MASQFSDRAAGPADLWGTGSSMRAITRRIGLTLRSVYENPEADPLPTDHVDLLLRLRHKEREQSRSRR